MNIVKYHYYEMPLKIKMPKIHRGFAKPKGEDKKS